MTLDATVSRQAAPSRTFPRAFLRRVPPVRAPTASPVVASSPSPIWTIFRLPRSAICVSWVCLGRPPAQALWARCTGSFRRSRTARPLPLRDLAVQPGHAGGPAVPDAAAARSAVDDRLGHLPARSRADARHRAGRSGGRPARGHLRHQRAGDLAQRRGADGSVDAAAPRGPVAGRSRRPNSFVLDFTDAGRTVRAEVRLDERGAPADFRTDDRYADLPGGLVRARWSTPVEGWTVRSGRPCFTRASAVWQLPDGPFRYATLTPIDVRVT